MCGVVVILVYRLFLCFILTFRFLCAREMRVDSATRLMNDYMHWRTFTFPKGVMAQDILEDVASGKCYCHFRDKQNRPVMVCRFRYHDNRRSVEQTLKLMVFALDGMYLF